MMSNGDIGYRLIIFYLTDHLANHGYVVASIDHTGSSNREVGFSKNLLADFPSTLYNRVRDQQFLLDHISTASSSFWFHINAESAVVIEYSMAAMELPMRLKAAMTLARKFSCFRFSGAITATIGKRF